MTNESALLSAIAIDGPFTGSVERLADESRSSAIAKARRVGVVRIGPEGLEGDEHADRQAHGGSQQALHVLPSEHLARLKAAFPDAVNLHPGGLGENFSSQGGTEEAVCIGDIFALGTARVQISQPRTPCWKIDRRCGTEGVAAFIAKHGCAGWYYRVLEAGDYSPGDALIHLERLPDAVSLFRLHSTLATHRPALQVLDRMANAPGLSPEWEDKIRARMRWLIDNNAA